MTEPLTLQLNLSAALENLDLLRMNIQELLEKLPVQPALEVIYQVQLAASEIFANIIEHACKFDSPQPVRVQLRIEKNSVLFIEFQDTCSSFVLEEVPPVDPENLPERGLGLYLTRQLVDELRYTSHQDYNEWRLVKHLKTSAEKPHACHSAG
jgi:serine/threonine-protein kinase RsbW